MPPRYAYWTILVDDQPTAFRSGSQEELMPTFKRLQQKHASAKMMWWQNGKLWNSRLDAQEAMRARGEIGRRRDPRQEERGRRPFRPAGDRAEKPQWKPKGSFKPERSARPEWRPKSHDESRAKDQKFAAEGRESRRSAKREGGLEWTPKGEGAPQSRSYPKSQAPSPKPPEKRKWIPKDEYKRSQAPSPKSQVPKDKNWRPGGEHKDPRQKYKDAKKAKWGRFKQTIRKRWEGKKSGK